MTQLGALTLAAEVGDWRRFATASQFMGFCGLVPSELLQRPADLARTANQGRQRPPARAVGRVGLVLLVPPAVGAQIARRQHGLDPQVVVRAGAAQLRLCGRFRRLAARKTSKNLVVAAIAGAGRILVAEM